MRASMADPRGVGFDRFIGCIGEIFRVQGVYGLTPFQKLLSLFPVEVTIEKTLHTLHPCMVGEPCTWTLHTLHEHLGRYGAVSDAHVNHGLVAALFCKTH